MKKIRTCVVLLFVAVAVMVAACTKEDPKVPESKLVGTWQVPLAAGGDVIQGVGGKDLVICDDHTASLVNFVFDNWKIEGDVLTFSNLIDHGNVYEMEVLKYEIVEYLDTAMILNGSYTHLIGDSVYLQGDMSGLYRKKK